MTLSEFELIRRFFTHPARNAVLGVGDDAAIVRARRGRELVVTTDMLVAGRHFRADADPEQLGHKALAVNLSDIAAMGASPRWATLALALPRADARWLAAFSRGFMRLARRHGVD
ncbi:MAG: AIR synthase related protein, partial [Terriglobales bacterium]